MPNSITFIINPASRFGKTKSRVKKLVKEIKAQAKNAQIELTRHSLHATNITKSAIVNGCDRIVVIGGDGTLNEVVNGFFDNSGKPHNKETSLAIIPSGSGSDFVRSIDQSVGLSAQVSRAIYGEALKTDVGLVCAQNSHGEDISRYFINVASFGLSGLALGFMDDVTKKMGPKAAYFLAASKAIRNFMPPTIVMKYGDNQEKVVKKCSLVGFANGRFFGGGMQVAPHARVDDGLLDVITVKDLSLMFFLVNGFKVYSGNHLHLEKVHSFRASECSVHAQNDDDVYIETDGELFAQLPATFSVKAGVIKVVR